MNHLEQKHYIISRIDNIGDVVLTLPLIEQLKKYDPSCRITFLARYYTHPVLKCCPAINQYLDWEKLKTKSDAEIIKQLQAQNAHVIIHLLPAPRLSVLARKAKIPMRIGTARRWYHWLNCTHCVKITANDKRKYHEYELNIKLLDPLGIKAHLNNASHVLLPELDINRLPTSEHIKIDRILPPSNRFQIIIHPGSLGHGREWNPSLFVKLIHSLPQDRYHILLCGSSRESVRFKGVLADLCPKATNLMEKLSLDAYIILIARSNGFIASGTGPLHIAAALGIPTLGLFPAKQNIGSTRWRPIGRKAQYLVSNNCQECQSASDCDCMTQITVEQVQNVILQWFESTSKCQSNNTKET